MRDSQTFEPPVVTRPRRSMMSLSAIGTPWNLPAALPARRAASAAVAAARASSAYTSTKAPSLGSRRSIRASNASTSRSEVSSPVASASAAALAVRNSQPSTVVPPPNPWYRCPARPTARIRHRARSTSPDPRDSRNPFTPFLKCDVRSPGPSMNAGLAVRSDRWNTDAVSPKPAVSDCRHVPATASDRGMVVRSSPPRSFTSTSSSQLKMPCSFTKRGSMVNTSPGVMIVAS